jgi:hypothetical protein
MARRRNLKDLTTPDPTPDKQLAHPSGWCMTLSHEFCPHQFSHGKCGCSCHLAPKSGKSARTNVSDDSKTQKTQEEAKSVVSISDTPKKRGRPKKVQNIASTNTDQDYIDPRPWRRKEN